MRTSTEVRGRICDNPDCDDLVTDRWRTRHHHCPPPPLPASALEAIAIVRNMKGNRDRASRS